MRPCRGQPWLMMVTCPQGAAHSRALFLRQTLHSSRDVCVHICTTWRESAQSVMQPSLWCNPTAYSRRFSSLFVFLFFVLCLFLYYPFSLLFPLSQLPVIALQCSYACMVKLRTTHWLVRISILTMRMWKGGMGCIPQVCQKRKG